MTADQRPPVACGRWVDGGLRLDVRVQARASALRLGEPENGRVRLRLTSPPVDGKANEQARRLLAKSFGVGPTRVELVSGASSRNKSFLIREPRRIPAQLRAD